MALTITAVEIKETAKKYHMLPNSLKVQVYILFEQGLAPREIVNRNLLSGLKEITIHSYYSEWGRRRQ